MLSRAYLPLYCHINVCTEICAVLGFWAMYGCNSLPNFDTICRSHPTHDTERCLKFSSHWYKPHFPKYLVSCK
jgi:hypothetical protein